MPRPPLTLFIKIAALVILFERVKMLVHRLTNKPSWPMQFVLPLKIILALPLTNAFNVENPDIWKRLAVLGPKQMLQYLCLLVKIKHQDCVLGTKKAIIRLINTDQNCIRMVPLWSLETAIRVSPGPHKQWGHTLWAHPSAYLQPLSGLDLPTQVTVWINEFYPLLTNHRPVAILTGIQGPFPQGP